MNHNETLKITAARLDKAMKFKGILEWFDGMAIEAILKAAYENMPPEVATEFIQLCDAFNKKEWAQLADEGGDILAEIVKLVWISKFKK